MVFEAATLVALYFLLVLAYKWREQTGIHQDIFIVYVVNARTENFVCLGLLGGTSGFSGGGRSSAGDIIGSRRSGTLASVFLTM